MKNLAGLMEQAREMQVRMEAAKSQVADLQIEGKSGGGLVLMVLSGAGHMQSLKIDPELLDKDEAEILEDLIVAAYHDAKIKLDREHAETMKSAMSGIQLPPGMEMPF